jgi:hypothetical protein
MKSESARYLELVERRVSLLRALVRAETEWRRAFIGLDMQNAERCAADEEQLCANIRTIDSDIATLQANQSKRSGAGSNASEFSWPKTPDVDSRVHQSIRAALGQMMELHLDLKRANETRQAILRRSRYTVSALRNLFNSYASTYGAPVAPGVGTIYEERV